jgi:WD40 repeat protein
MSNLVQECYEYQRISTATDTVIKIGGGQLGGVFVASSSSGTIKVWDNTSGSGAVLVNTFTAVPGTYHPLPFRFRNGLTITTTGTIDCTVAYL